MQRARIPYSFPICILNLAFFPSLFVVCCNKIVPSWILYNIRSILSKRANLHFEENRTDGRNHDSHIAWYWVGVECLCNQALPKSMCKCELNGKHPSSAASDMRFPRVSVVLASFSNICVASLLRWSQIVVRTAADATEPGTDGWWLGML